MRKRVIERDWSTTPLGPSFDWPQSLSTAVDMVLGSPLAMIVLWGPDLIQIYNDAYALIAGARHPAALGQPTRECWPEVWAFNQPVYAAVLAGEARSFPGQLLVIERSGVLSDAWFDLTYSSLHDDAGDAAGVLVTVVETSDRILADRRMAAQVERQRRLFDQAPGFICISSGPEHIYEFVNDAYARLCGERDYVGKTVREALPDIAGQGFYELLDTVYKTGERFVAENLAVRMTRSLGAAVEERFVDFTYEPIVDEAGEVTGVFTQGHDVTEAHLARDAQRVNTEFLRGVLASSNDCIKVLDLDANLTFMSEGGQLIMEVSDFNAIRGCPWLDFWQGEGNIDAVAALEAAKGGSTGRFQGAAPTMAGTPKWWDVQITAIPGPDSRPAQLLCVSRDISDQKQAELALRDLNADLERQVTERTREQGLTWQVSPDLMAVVNQEGCFERSNPAWRSVLGWSEEELRHTRVFDLIHPEDLKASYAAFDQLQSGRPVLRFENRYRSKGGQWCWLSWVAVPEAGKFYCSARDVTAEKAQAESLAESTAERDRVWQNSRDMLVVASADGVFRAVNPAWTRVLGYEASEMVGRSFREFVWPDDVDATNAAIETVSAGGNLSNFENRYRHKDGTPRWISWQTSFEDGAIYAYARDITVDKERGVELLAIEAQLRQAQKMEAVGQLTGGIAHDFNNMLMGILGGLAIVQRRIAAGRYGDVDRFIDAARNSGERAASLTKRLLAFSRSQSLHVETLDAHSLALGMDQLLRQTLGAGVVLVMVAKPELWQVHADASQLENALLNLAINARDAMPGGGQLTIEMTNVSFAEGDRTRPLDLGPGDYVAFSVRDTGSGMPQAVIDRAFDPFFTTKRAGEGTGLGLSMIFGFAKQSRGHVAIESEVGRGTKVTLLLPRATTDVMATAGQNTVRPNSAQPGDTVMIVDDEDAVRLVMADVLTELGYEHFQATNGAAAMAILQSEPSIDLLITDVAMPGMSGKELAVLARRARPGLKILFVTGYAAAEGIRGGLDDGTDLLCKPFALDALGEKVRAMLAGAPTRDLETT